ncbi:MAG: hypothetical protein QNL12_13120 [Acidimicrobiia bacterium]|nr:hypothetical protein [Acidimicrobiia bacterium]MDX2468253.1 hypothetical protein [Acidimicrobiia bacterium]
MPFQIAALLAASSWAVGGLVAAEPVDSGFGGTGPPSTNHLGSNQAKPPAGAWLGAGFAVAGIAMVLA